MTRPTPHTFCFDRMRPIVLIVPIILMITLAVPAFAAEHPEQDTKQAMKTGVEFQPRLGEYHYEIHWGWKRLATGIITIRKDGAHYVLTADKRTTDVIDKTYRIRYTGETRIDAAALAPTESVIKEQINSKRKVQKATYDKDNGSVKVEVTKTKKKSEPETNTYELQSDTGIMDIFSFLFLSRSFDWSIGERHEFMVFIGKKQYEVNLDCIGMNTYQVEDSNVPVWVIRPQARKTDDDDPSFKDFKTQIYISADDSRDILKVKSDPGIGTVRLTLVKYLEK